MRKTVFLFLILVNLGIYAQHAFYVHTNDRQIHPFLFEMVDSMTVSETDPLFENVSKIYSQIIWTKDSVYQFPLSSIDSISYQTPSTIYKEGVVLIDDELKQYIVGSDSLNIIFRDDTPTDLLPSKGSKLLSLEVDEQFPMWFMGKVLTTYRQEDNIVISCEQAYIPDMFNRYYGVFIGNRRQSQEKLKKIGTDNYFNVDIPGELSVDIKGDVGNLSNNCGWTLEGKVAVLNPHIAGCFIYNPEFGFFTSITVKGEVELSANFSASGTAEAKKEIPLLSGLDFAVCPGLYIHNEIGLTVSVEGSIDVGAGIKHTTPFVFTMNASDGNNVENIPTNWLPKFGKPTFEITPITVSGDVSFKLGPYYKAGINVIAKEISTIYFKVEGGVKLGIHAEIGSDDIMNIVKNTSVYDKFQDNLYWYSKIYNSYGIEGSLFNYKGEWGLKDVEIDLDDKWEAKLLPKFTYLKFQDQGNVPSIKVGVDDIVLPAIPVGIKLYDENNCELFSDYYDKKYINGLWFSRSFDNFDIALPKEKLRPNKTYKVRPIVKLFGVESLSFAASPDKQFSLNIDPVTDSAGGIGFYEATISGHLEGLTSYLTKDCKCGFIYGKNTNLDIKNGIIVECQLDADNNYHYELNNLEDDTKYYYKSIFMTDGSYYYGQTKSFETLKIPTNAIDLGLSVLWGEFNVGANSESETGTFYGWADVSGQNTSYDVLNETGGQWISNLYGGAHPPADICGTSLDMANANWRGDWRLPSEEEMVELINECTWEWSDNNGTKGMIVTGPNGNSIFLPAGGDRFGNEQREYGKFGYYWTGTLNTERTHNAYRLEFDDCGPNCTSYARYIGHLVRPVINHSK